MAERDELFFKRKNAYDILPEDDIKRAYDFAEEYKAFLDESKTEREAVRYAVRAAGARGFVPYEPGMEIKPGAKVYKTVEGKAIMLAVIGNKPLSEGVNIAAAHVDVPRLDLKQVPLYEEAELAFFKTHYYGGIKKYQWVTIPLSLHGVVVRRDGTAVDVVIGEDEGDPVFTITDLLPHLDKDQAKKTLSEAFTGEGLNILIGSRPFGDEKDSDRVKHNVLRLLHERYGITEEDFLSAELEAVPAGRARDAGLDRSLILAYGQDDRSCAFAALSAILEIGTPEKTAVCVLTDKEEIGSDGVTGMQSAAFEAFMSDLCRAQGVLLHHCFEKSFCLSADVCNAYDPNYADVSEKNNSAKLNYGIGVLKFTGSRGKSGSSDASAETVGMLRALFEKHGVRWQMAELGKVDQGGGGTVAKYMANRGIATIDAGIPLLSMHAPYEIAAKLDIFYLKRAVFAVYCG